MEQTSIFMCNFCFPDAKEIGIISPGYALIYKDRLFHILGHQGHKEDEIFTFPVTPWEAPEEVDVKYNISGLKSKYTQAELKWFKDADKTRKAFVVPVEEGYFFILSLKKEKMQPGCPVSWVFNKCGKLIRMFLESGKKL
jgi:hypothetical protein